MIRDAHWSDLPTLAELEHSTYPHEPWSEESFWGDLARDARYVVHEEAGVIDGYAGIFLHPDEGHVQTVAVTPPARGRGIGAAMLDALLGKARAAGLATVTLEVASRNAPARHIYDAAGFVQVGFRKDYYAKEQDDAVLMTVTL